MNYSDTKRLNGVPMHYPKVMFVLIISLLIASSWLVFPYLIQGKSLLLDAGDSSILPFWAALSARLWAMNWVITRVTNE